MVSYTEAAIIATTVQAVLTGGYFATFLLCLQWQIFPDSDHVLNMSKKFKWTMLIVSITVFALSTTDIGISLEATLLAAEGNDIPLFAGVIAFAVEALTAIIIDSALIYRCWATYQKAWLIVALPLLLLLYNFASVIMVTYWGATSIANIRTAPYKPVQESILATTVFINVYATSAIIIQIWRKNEPGCLRFIRAVAEPGLLYTLTSIAPLCAIFIKDSHNGFPYPLMMASAINLPVSGIAFNLMILILIWAAKNSVPSSTAQRVSNLEFYTTPVTSKILDEEQRIPA